jgi:type II secretory pathway component PulF
MLHMQKNARGYVQDSCTLLNEAKSSLEQALQTVERDSNREHIQQSLQTVESALQQCSSTASVLEQI